MSKINYTLNFERIAVINIKNRKLLVGNVVEYMQLLDGSINLSIEFNPLLPNKIKELIQKAPQILNIELKEKKSLNVSIIA